MYIPIYIPSYHYHHHYHYDACLEPVQLPRYIVRGLRFILHLPHPIIQLFISSHLDLDLLLSSVSGISRFCMHVLYMYILREVQIRSVKYIYYLFILPSMWMPRLTKTPDQVDRGQTSSHKSQTSPFDVVLA